MRLIDADDLKELFPDYGEGSWTYNRTARMYIDNAPTVKVESCRDCPFVEEQDKRITKDSCFDNCPLIQPKWIPVTTRDMTEEEAKELLDGSDLKDFYNNPTSYWLYNCRLPDEGQEVLVSTKWGVTLTTFYCDADYGNYFEDYEDRYDVDAWMPLPEAYKKGEEE